MTDKKLRKLAEIFAEDFQSTFPFEAQRFCGEKFHCIAISPLKIFMGWDKMEQVVHWGPDDSGWTSLKPKKKIVIEAWGNDFGSIFWKKVGVNSGCEMVGYTPTGITLEADECSGISATLTLANGGYNPPKAE